MQHQLIFIISGEKSDLNDIPVKPHDAKEKDMEAGHSNSGNEDEGHASTQRVYMHACARCCNNIIIICWSSGCTVTVVVFHERHHNNYYHHDDKN